MEQLRVPTHPRIMLVEDDDGARASLARVLDRAGYQVLALPDGEQACEQLDQHPQAFDVVLTDLLLREIDGVGVLKAARALPEPPEVILLTGYGTLQTAVEALRAGAFDYLLKPSKPDDLLRCVSGAVRRRNERIQQTAAIRVIAQGLAQLQGEPTAHAALARAASPGGLGGVRLIQIGDLIIDRLDHRVLFMGAALALTPTEFELLCCLAEAEGQTLTYSQMVRRVYHHLVDDGAAHQLLKTHIHNLRQKLHRSYIVNVRSTGYRLVAPEAHDLTA